MKWSFLKSNARSLKTNARPNKRWLLLAVFTSLFTVAAFAVFAPKTSYADVGNNDLLLIGEHCHDLHEITHDFGIGQDGRCHDGNGGKGWQEVLSDSLSCSNTMFYQHDNPADPNDASVVNTLWYTKQGDYKDCYNKAQNMKNAMSDPDGICHVTKDGSDNHDKCTSYQDHLYDALGCNNSMFQSYTQGGDKYWKIKPDARDDCQHRIDAVGNIHIIIIGSDGQPVPNGDPISSASVAATDPNDGGNGGGNGDLTCDTKFSSPLSWVICPTVDLMVTAISAVDNLITDQMSIPTESIFCNNTSGNDDSCQAYYSAWSSFRNLALGFMVIAGLIIVISQALGMEVLDAYTVRKTLPRLLVAAVAITLSWTLMNFAVTLSNNLGFGVRDLITAPFHSLSSNINLGSFFGGGAALAGGAVAAIPVWIAFGGLGVLISYVATAGLAVLIAILVLIIREIVIIMMILISPIALIAYVLPNTQRIFRLWWESFSKALLMFPMIAAFIAIGRVFAAISLQNGGPIAGFIGFISYFAPYFLIPLTFRFAGGALSGIGGAIQQRSQGISGALSGFRGNQRQQRVQRARTEGLYRPGLGKIPGTNRSVGKALNRVGFWGLNADEMIPYKLGTTNVGKAIDGKRGIPGFRRGGQELESEIKRAKRDQTLQAVQDLDIGYKSGRMMGGQFSYFRKSLNDKNGKSTDAGIALDKEFGIGKDENGNVNAWRAPDTWGERQRVAQLFEGAEGEGAVEAREASTELKATASEFEKYTKSPETNRVDGRLLGLVSAAKAGRLEVGDVVANQNRLMDAGNQEDAIRETTILQDALTPKRVSAARGHSISYDTEGYAHNVYDNPVSPKAQNSLMRINTQEIAAGKSEDVDALANTLIAGASQYKMDWDFENKRLKPQTDPKTGGPALKDPNSTEGQRVSEIRNRIKTLAMYNSGDSDVGVKVKDIWVNQLRLPESDLDWGGRGGDERDREIAFGPAAKPPDGADQQGQQGPQPK